MLIISQFLWKGSSRRCCYCFNCRRCCCCCCHAIIGLFIGFFSVCVYLSFFSFKKKNNNKRERKKRLLRLSGIYIYISIDICIHMQIRGPVRINVLSVITITITYLSTFTFFYSPKMFSSTQCIHWVFKQSNNNFKLIGHISGWFSRARWQYACWLVKFLFIYLRFLYVSIYVIQNWCAGYQIIVDLFVRIIYIDVVVVAVVFAIGFIPFLAGLLFTIKVEFVYYAFHSQTRRRKRKNHRHLKRGLKINWMM